MQANRLKELRMEHGYTIEEVGKKIGIKKSSYASYETKYRQPPIDKLKSISKLYGVTTDYLLGLSEDRNSDECFQRKFKELCTKKRLHWDGQEIPEEVLTLIQTLLENSLQENYEEDIIC